MEIHAPDHPITGWKETVKHLAIITAGVLIALTLEGIVSWIDHRMLVREAVGNLTAELRNNRKELASLFSGLDKDVNQLEHCDDVAAKLIAHASNEHLDVDLSRVPASHEGTTNTVRLLRRPLRA